LDPQTGEHAPREQTPRQSLTQTACCPEIGILKLKPLAESRAAAS
jgi:hypothetical protein